MPDRLKDRLLRAQREFFTVSQLRECGPEVLHKTANSCHGNLNVCLWITLITHKTPPGRPLRLLADVAIFLFRGIRSRRARAVVVTDDAMMAAAAAPAPAAGERSDYGVIDDGSENLQR